MKKCEMRMAAGYFGAGGRRLGAGGGAGALLLRRDLLARAARASGR